MAVIEDEFLSNLFHQAADSFEVPEAGIDEIIRRARGFEPVPAANDEDGNSTESLTSDAELPLEALSGSRTQNIRKVVRQHRVLSIAAAVVVVVAALGTTGALLTKSSTPPRVGGRRVVQPPLRPARSTCRHRPALGLHHLTVPSPHRVPLRHALLRCRVRRSGTEY